MNQPKDLLSIGTFANMTRLSIKALRLYDQLDLLQPHHVDTQTGYRYYRAEQLSPARMIRNLREMDMPLATIRQVLAALADSPKQAEVLVRDYLSMREKQIEQLRTQVQHFMAYLQKETAVMKYEVTLKTIPAQQVLSLTHRVTVDKLDATIRESLDTLYALSNQQNAHSGAAPFGIYYGAINMQEDGPIEICLPVKENVTVEGNVVLKELAGGKAASVVLLGNQCEFPEILNGYDAAADWIQKNGYEMAEAPREVWHTAPGVEAQMEIVWLFK
ncbi:MAG: helix-turn-helix domain-containing protein [Anaerolineales bacterium]